MTDEQELLAKFLEFADADYVPNSLFDRARALLASKPAVPQPVAVYPQGVMGIPPYSPPGSGSMTVEPGISWNATAPAQPCGDAEQAEPKP